MTELSVNDPSISKDRIVAPDRVEEARQLIIKFRIDENPLSFNKESLNSAIKVLINGLENEGTSYLSALGLSPLIECIPAAGYAKRNIKIEKKDQYRIGFAQKALYELSTRSKFIEKDLSDPEKAGAGSIKLLSLMLDRDEKYTANNIFGKTSIRNNGIRILKKCTTSILNRCSQLTSMH